jgi:hypothetical protein
MSANPSSRPPLAIRISARWALISLLIALATLILWELLESAHFPVMPIRVGFIVVFLAASAVGITSLLMWVIASGVHIVFGPHEEDGSGPPTDWR